MENSLQICQIIKCSHVSFTFGIAEARGACPHGAGCERRRSRRPTSTRHGSTTRALFERACAALDWERAWGILSDVAEQVLGDDEADGRGPGGARRTAPRADAGSPAPRAYTKLNSECGPLPVGLRRLQKFLHRLGQFRKEPWNEALRRHVVRDHRAQSRRYARIENATVDELLADDALARDLLANELEKLKAERIRAWQHRMDDDAAAIRWRRRSAGRVGNRHTSPALCHSAFRTPGGCDGSGGRVGGRGQQQGRPGAR